MKRLYFLLLALLLVNTSLHAQRFTDKLDRGVVAVPVATGNFVSWRRFGEEYYDVTYNLYRGTTRVASNLKATHFFDTEGDVNSQYTVCPVVRGIEQMQDLTTGCTPWNSYNYSNTYSGYLDIKLEKVKDRNGVDVTSHYSNNDAEVADLNGDGQPEIIIKRLNTVDATAIDLGYKDWGNNTSKPKDERYGEWEVWDIYPASNTTEFVVIEAYDVDWKTGEAKRMWWIDCGPNMVSLNSTEIDVIAYDWDMDGKAEVVLRGADDMRIHYKVEETEYTQIIGDPSKCYRNFRFFEGENGSQYAWTHEGDEFLIYMNGETGQPYQVLDYPLKRLEDGETDLNAAWGDGYGHRSSKYFFGAPYLDGQHPSLFLARGIYTRHKMVAIDIDPKTHELTQSWSWTNNKSGSPWYGQGYHNFIIADVDEDGCDEIVFGSMVIDDTGKGLSTTGLGHGDAQHVSDFDPYRKGLEFFGCNEDHPGMNYRNATTSEMYVRMEAAKDDGRGLMGNFSNSFPGSLGRSVSTDVISSVVDKVVMPAPTETRAPLYWSNLNFRIYWDGDLCSEILNSPGTAKEAKIDKEGYGRLFTSDGCNMNNDSKNNPCFQGDIIGDWREEIIVRYGEKIRVYTSAIDTDYDFYTLWHDHQYRQAMAWQMMAYNQPPHLSFFLGEMEGITVAPPPLTNTGRTQLNNGATITTENNGQHLLLAGYENKIVNVGEGAEPEVLTVNAPAWVEGNDNNNNITTTTYQHTITGDALSGDMRLTKQGWGQLVLSDNTHTYTGPTEVWQGTLTFNGELPYSPMWLNRFTSLNSSKGTFNSIKADYGASINIGGATANVSSINIGTLNLGFGSKVVFDITGNNVGDNDQLIVGVLNIEKKTEEVWVNYGPEYLAPRFRFNSTSTPTALAYPLGQIGELAEGCSLDDIILEGIDQSRNPQLVIEDGILMLKMDGAMPTVAPELAVIDMVQTEIEEYPVESGPYYMPKVGMRAKSDKTTLSGYFTDTQGNTTNLDAGMFETTRFSQDFESSTDASGWTCNMGVSLGSDDTHGIYLNFSQDGGSGSRYAYKSFMADVENDYCVEFDAALHYCIGNYDDNSVILYGGNVPQTVKSVPYLWTGSSDYVFRLTGGKNYGTSYTVEGDNNSFTLTDNTWYHFLIKVNQTTGKVAYTVFNGATILTSGSYSIADSNVNMKISGLFVNLGRSNSNAKFDNFIISNDGEPAFTFTKLGTLYLTASENGYSDNTISMTVEQPYVIKYDSPDFSTIAAFDAASVLGADLWQVTASTGGRWAYWADGTYTYATAIRQNTMYVDTQKVLWANLKSGHPGSRLLQLVEGYGLGQNNGSAEDSDGNEGTVFHAAGLGDDKTIIYHRYDLSRGAATKTYLSEYIRADENGNYDYDCGGNFTLQKFTAYVPYDGFLLGDANGDGKVTVADVMLTVNYVLKGNVDRFLFRNADVNLDNIITVADIMGIVNILLH